MRGVLMKLYGVFEAELLVYYQHRKFVSRAYENTGHFASREGISRDAGHMGQNTGCPGKYWTVGNPKSNRQIVVYSFYFVCILGYPTACKVVTQYKSQQQCRNDWNLSSNSECCLWYDGKRGRRGDLKFSNRPVTFESNRDVRFEFESNLEASQVPKYFRKGTHQLFTAR